MIPDPLLDPIRELGTSKIIKILATVGDFNGFAIFSLDRFRTSILDPLGLPFGTFLAPKMAETSLGLPLGAAKSRSRLVLFGPEGLQERSKRRKRGFQKGGQKWTPNGTPATLDLAECAGPRGGL